MILLFKVCGCKCIFTLHLYFLPFLNPSTVLIVVSESDLTWIVLIGLQSCLSVADKLGDELRPLVAPLDHAANCGLTPPLVSW